MRACSNAKGGISGRVFGSPAAGEGDYIETSPIVDGTIESGYVVMTTSGSRYFLSADVAQAAANIYAPLDGITNAPNSRSGTITINKSRNREQVAEAMKMLESAPGRSTFSLQELGIDFMSKRNKQPQQQQPMQQPTNDFYAAIYDRAPRGVPILARWSTNNDGSITGEVYGSQVITDGDVVTTSPIAQGNKQQFECVQTASGSMYYLA